MPTNPMRSMSGIADDLVQYVDSVSPSHKRRIAEAVARWALSHVGESGQAIDQANECLRLGLFGDSPERRLVERHVEQLDELAWDAQDREKLVDATPGEYDAVFSLARAVHSLWFAMSADPDEAAREHVRGVLRNGRPRWSATRGPRGSA
jgi:hypothetical protein